MELKMLVGRHGIAKTVMLPAGDIQVDDRVFDAVSEGMPIEAGQGVVVTRVEGNRITVRPHTTLDVTRDQVRNDQDDILSQPIDSLGLDGFNDSVT